MTEYRKPRMLTQTELLELSRDRVATYLVKHLGLPRKRYPYDFSRVRVMLTVAGKTIECVGHMVSETPTVLHLTKETK
jgi:hypothetical protein